MENKGKKMEDWENGEEKKNQTKMIKQILSIGIKRMICIHYKKSAS